MCSPVLLLKNRTHFQARGFKRKREACSLVKHLFSKPVIQSKSPPSKAGLYFARWMNIWLCDADVISVGGLTGNCNTAQISHQCEAHVVLIIIHINIIIHTICF